MSNPVATLSTSGSLEDPYDKADRLLSYFFLSNALQSNLWSGNISSIQDIIKRVGHDDRALEQEVNAKFYPLLQAHFDGSELDVSVVRTTNDAGDVVQNITINAVVIDNEKRYSLGRLVNVVDSKISRISEINNG